MRGRRDRSARQMPQVAARSAPAPAPRDLTGSSSLPDLSSSTQTLPSPAQP